MPELIHVAAAAIFNPQGKVLLALRSKKQHQGGLWEFPGGKVESGESVRDALARELEEELGIRIDQASTRPLIQVPYHYLDKSVLLDVFKVSGFSGVPHGAEGQPLEWADITDLDSYDFPAANTPIVNALLLPEKIAITGTAESNAQYIEKSSRALNKGAQWLMLRAHGLESAERVELARTLMDREGADLCLNGSVEEANLAGVDALHLTSSKLMEMQDRSVFKGRWLSASCHNEEQLQKAVALGLDFVTLSPVNPTATHPDQEGIGWDVFSQLANAYPLPVYALGGMTAENLETCWERGGQGICAIREFW
ncbi:Nudix family hydrolase [Aliamphritea spongicola]|uniref:Nudix family hydrolase n=1 Tax=Aliamphritea spongicola TaxID=707589 RepID=UPI00196B2FD1|nr:Nudix family hydrolase [Aliamphritea spongicola]MBN3563401.1 Nudix family hydrolase [Aliamphritea spongicola]